MSRDLSNTKCWTDCLNGMISAGRIELASLVDSRMADGQLSLSLYCASAELKPQQEHESWHRPEHCYAMEIEDTTI